MINRLLSEVECLEVFASRAVASVDEAEEFFLLRLTISLVSVGRAYAVLVDEFFDGEVASSNPNDDLVFLDLHEYALLAVLVNAFLLSF